MVQKVVVQLVDDVDGTTSDDITTARFGLDGVAYEIDLTAANGDRLREGLAGFVANARKVGGRAKRGSGAILGAWWRRVARNRPRRFVNGPRRMGISWPTGGASRPA